MVHYINGREHSMICLRNVNDKRSALREAMRIAKLRGWILIGVREENKCPYGWSALFKKL